MKLSVIIPVYRVEDTLQHCVESVLGQHVDDMEVILVDDGSPDRCPQLCDEWALRDSRIIVIHKDNGGLSDARNTGIDIAQGDYLTFIDSDDYLAPNTYGPLLGMMGDSDLLEFSIANRLTLEDRTYHDPNSYWLEAKAYQHTYACNKIYRRSLFRDIRYPKGKVFEDAYTLPRLLRQAHQVTTTTKGYYHYCYNPHGITATADGQALAMLLEAHLGSNMPMNDEYYMHLVNIQTDVYELTCSPVVLPHRYLDSHAFSGKDKIKAIILNALGINFLCKSSKLLHRLRKPNRL